MRVIRDTNALLGALISPHGAPDEIYHAWRSVRFDLATSVAQIDELREEPRNEPRRVSRHPKLNNSR